MDEFFIVLLRGIGQGAVLAIIALAFNATFNSSGVLNFAQGQFVVIGGIAGLTFLSRDPGVAVWLVVGLGATGAVAAVAAVQGLITIIPMRGRDDHSWVVSTLAASVILGAVLLLMQGPNLLRVPTPLGPVELLGVSVPGPYVASFGLLCLWAGGLFWFRRSTLTGLAMQALSQDADAAKATGIQPLRLQVLAFAISGALAASAGFVAGPVIQVSAHAGFELLMAAFTAAVIGGLGSMAGALTGGFSMGVITVLVSSYVDTDAGPFVSLAILALILMLRPQGLMGKPALRRV